MPVSMLHLYVRVNLLFLVVSVYAYVVPNHVVSLCTLLFIFPCCIYMSAYIQLPCCIYMRACNYLTILYLYLRMYLPINVVLIFADVFTFPCCIYICAHIFTYPYCFYVWVCTYLFMLYLYVRIYCSMLYPYLCMY